MSRRTPPRRPRAAKSPWLPLVPVAIAIVIGGLAIGAGLSKVFTRPDDGANVAVAPSPLAAQATPAPHQKKPVIVATIVPRITPSPEPTPSDLPSPSPEPSRSPTPSALPSLAASAAPSERPPPAIAPTAAPTTLATPVRKRSPAPPATMPPDAKPASATPSAQAVVPATPAVAVVRRYIDALKRGDEVGAFAALGGLPGDKGLSLTEESFVDSKARITSVHSTPSEDGSATVELEIAAAKGTYFATFHVIQNAKGFVIDQHDFIKP